MDAVATTTGPVLDIIKALISFGSMGPAGWIASGSLMVILAVGYGFLQLWLKKKKDEAAAKETEEQQNRQESKIVTDNNKVGSDASKSEDDIRKIMGDK